MPSLEVSSSSLDENAIRDYPRAMAPRRIHMLRQAQNGKCYLCGKRVPEPGEPCDRAQEPTRDHIKPRGAMRTNLSPPNVALTHEACNNAKGSRKPYACEVFYGEVIWIRLQSMFPDTYGEHAQRLWPIKHALTKIEREIEALSKTLPAAG